MTRKLVTVGVRAHISKEVDLDPSELQKYETLKKRAGFLTKEELAFLRSFTFKLYDITNDFNNIEGVNIVHWEDEIDIQEL